ncbi:MAG: PadR family transcriptional regulator [Candidatus Bathyarchaeia archaeon]
MSNIRNIQVKLMKGLIDLIVLQLLRSKPVHGYQIITSIRRTFGVYFGPSTIYPLLNDLEKSGYVTSEWDMSRERPRKVYRLTHEGRSLLNFAEESLSIICRKIGVAENLRMNHKEDERYSATFLNIVREKSS